MKKSGVQGFDKSSDDLVMKYSRDLVDGTHSWRTKANRRRTVELNEKQDQFDSAQKR